jgi:regulatory protein
MKNVSSEASEVRRCALRLLKFRPRSEQEIRQSLKRRAFSPSSIEETVFYLKKAGFLDDALFARLWIEDRLKKFFGFKRVLYELKEKGIEKGLIDAVFSETVKDLRESDFIEEVVRRKLEKLKGLDPLKVKTRLYGFLMRRGFPQSSIMDVLRRRIKSVNDRDMES